MQFAPTKTKSDRRSLLFWLAAVCLLCALPFANRDLAAGHDALFHILRIEGLAQSIRGGAGWPQPVYSLLCGGYGYAAGMFYPDVFLLPAALLRAGGLGPELAFKFEVLLFAFLAALFSYHAGRAITHSHRGGLLLMVLYSLCQYHFSNLFIRSALGELQAMAFLPLVIWGLYDLTEENFQKPWVLCAGFTGLLLTHTISLALCGLFAVGWVVCRLPRVLRGKTPAKLGGAAAVCLLLGCYYWLPLLEQFGADTFKVTTQPLTTLAANVVPAADYFNLQNYSAPGFTGFLMPVAALVLLAVAVKRQGKAGVQNNLLALGLLVAGVGLGLLPLAGLLPWQALDKTFLTSVQFPWRVNMLSQFCLALCCSLLGSGAAKGDVASDAASTKQAGWGRAAVAAAFAFSAVNFACQWGNLPALCNYPGNYFTSQRGETFYLVGQEWVPSDADITEFALEPDARYTNSDGAFTGEYLPDGSFQLPFDGTVGAYGIPKLYYKGYTARYTPAGETPGGAAAQPLPLHKDGAGRVELAVPENLAPGTITVRYTGTTVQHLSAAVSLGTLGALLVLSAGKWYGSRQRKTQKRIIRL